MTVCHVLKTITPETIAPNADRIRAACRGCGWMSAWVKFAESIETLAALHVHDTGHTVDIEERV